MNVENIIESQENIDILFIDKFETHENIIKSFISLKNLTENLQLDEETNNTIKIIIGNTSNNKITKNNSILKNTKIQQKKDTITNKVNLILNKLSENNINNLLIEFIDNIGAINITNYEEVLQAFYKKMINEINFINIYLKFLNIIGFIYNKNYNYSLEYFFNIIEIKFRKDYNVIDDNIIDTKFYFINCLSDDNARLNNLTLIKKLIDFNLLKKDLINYCDNIIINQNIYLSDIYFWFEKRQLPNEYINKISILLNTTRNIRERILLDNLIKNNTK
jgi:hypothetical protein